MEIYAHRQFILYLLFGFVGLVFLIKLFSLQVLDDSYQIAAEQNALRKIVVHPHRGLIYDRKGELLVYNEPIYDLMVIPGEVEMSDTLKFCRLVGISKEDFIARIKKIGKAPSGEVFIPQLSKIDYARIQGALIDYPGFFVSPRTMRIYPHQSLANTLGYIAEISPEQLKKDTTNYYTQGDYIGQSGVEASYEAYLRGNKGERNVVRDRFNRIVGAYREGSMDKASASGEDLVSSIDLELQALAEKLMENKVGAIVAIEPATGEILAVVSAPSYNPNLLTGPGLSKNFVSLSRDDYKPLFNRSTMSRYPPGSTFKTLQALVALQEGVIQPETRFPCAQNLVKCHGHPSPADVKMSVQYSCNPFYYSVFRRFVYKDGDSFDSLAFNYEIWRERISRFGFGRRLGVDIANEGNGSIPPIGFFNKAYGLGNWNYSNIYSLSIGQGEIGVTPMQMANLAAIIANRGHYYIPHLIKSIGKSGKPLPKYQERHEVGVDRRYFDVIVEGMEGAFRAGTVGFAAQMPYNKDIVICAKTGTVQNSQGEDHATFIAFAPKENPKIALTVYIENAGFGGVWAATVASLMIEQYLTDTIRRQPLLKQTIDKVFTQRDILRREAIRAERVRSDSLNAVLKRKEEEM